MTVRRDTSGDAMAEAIAAQRNQSAPGGRLPAGESPGATKPVSLRATKSAPRKTTPGPPSRAGATARAKFADDLDEAISLIGMLVGPRTQPRQRKLAGAVTARLKARAAQLRGG